MKLLLDTHAAIWVLSGDSRLSEKAINLYESAEDVVFSTVNLWEIGIKLALGRKDFQMEKSWWKTMPRAFRVQGVGRLDVEPEHCREVSRLALHHRDPFDRMLVAQAIVADCAILSRDPQLDHYPVTRFWD